MRAWNRMHRDHRFAQRRMPDAMDQELTPRQRARFARHVDGCPECGRMLRALILVRAAVLSLGAGPPAHASIVPAVLSHLHADDARGTRGRTR